MRLLATTVLLCSTAAAQLPFVSPTNANGVEGSTSNAIPFNIALPRRYQQIHGDLPQTGLVLNGLSFRINSPTTVTSYTGTRAIDLELYLGNGPTSYAKVARNLNANFSGQRTQTVMRRVVNWGPQGTSVLPGPQPFQANMDLALDAPFVWMPATPTLTWETVIYGNVGAGSFELLDADAGSSRTVTSTTVGSGCVCSGRSSAQVTNVVMADMQGYLGFAIGVTDGAPNAQVFTSIGFSDPNLPVPGLCASVHTDLTYFFAYGRTSAIGSLSTSAGFGMFLPNSLAGTQFFFQNFVVDPGMPVIPLCAGSGERITIPTSNLAKIVRVSRAFDSSGTTTANEGVFSTTQSLGYGLVVEFR